MKLQNVVEVAIGRLEEAEGLDAVASKLQGIISKATSPRQVKNLLSGVWLHHPVHPPLTDLTIGAFTSAAILDLLPATRGEKAVDVLIGAGLLSVVPTAATGANDWTDTHGGTRRVGLVHATANTVAALLYGASLIDRMRGRRERGVVFSSFGFLSLLVGGTLGGDLAYRRGLGVDENVFAPPIEDWVATISDEELPEKQLKVVTARDVEVLLYRVDGSIYALADRCGHLGGPLHEGHLHEEECLVSCPWHHSTFSLVDGSIDRGPASAPQLRYEARVQDGVVEVRSYPHPG